MKRGFIILLLTLFIGGYIVAGAFSKEADNGLCHANFSKKELLRDLAFSEKQVFDNTYTSDDITKRLERLELTVFGAIQDGSEDLRIKKLKKSVTNIASGGNGLNQKMQTLNLGGNSMGTTSWAIGNMHNFYPPITSYSYGRNQYTPYYKRSSHRLPPPPPSSYNYNRNPIVNGDFKKNYSIGTGLKILDD